MKINTMRGEKIVEEIKKLGTCTAVNEEGRKRVDLTLKTFKSQGQE